MHTTIICLCIVLGATPPTEEPAAHSPSVVSAPMETFPLPVGTQFKRWPVAADGRVTGGGAGEAVAGEERLIYSNTFSNFAGHIGTFLVLDDVATVGGGACRLKRVEFPVIGKVSPTGIGGPFSVEFALYSNCPGACPTCNYVIGGTRTTLSLPDDAPRLISYTFPSSVALPTNVWFGVKFSRNNAGALIGAPATTGISCDLFDFPGFPCHGALGGFPDDPQGSFHLQMFGDASTCTDAFVGYKNMLASGSIYNPGVEKYLIDDITLGVPDCQMVAYETVIKGVGFYELEMRQTCNGSTIAGTARTVAIKSGTEPRLIRHTFDPPIPLPEDLWFATKVNNTTAGIVIAGSQACVGETQDMLFLPGPTECSLRQLPDPSLHDAVSLTIICAGQPPVGACCDMIFPQCVGGADDGELCCPDGSQLPPFCEYDPQRQDVFPPCASPGTCESACRELPAMNCPWPPRFTNLNPSWAHGATCESDPFTYACGASACCRPEQTCENGNLNECNAVEPVDAPRVWQRGKYCDVGDQTCPIVACLAREGDCKVAHQEPGCRDVECCNDVCESDEYCCLVEWDRACAAAAGERCSSVAEHDCCWRSNTYPSATALPVDADSLTAFSNRGASAESSDPLSCCVGDESWRPAGTMWFKFVATDTSARISLCGSDPAGDSVVDVFAVHDASSDQTACTTLIPIACSDNLDGCGGGVHGSVCVRGLVPNNAYYLMVSSKSPQQQGLHQLDIRSPCSDLPIWASDDCNQDGLTDGCELARGLAADCNSNGLLDECDIASSRSFDCDGNAVPDDCSGLLATLRPSDVLQENAFGHSLDMDGQWLVVGSSGDYGSQPPPNGGDLFIYRHSPGGWREFDRLHLAEAPAYVALDGGRIVASSEHSSMAHLFTFDGTSWQPSGTLQGPEVLSCPRFGSPVAMEGELLALAKGFCQNDEAPPEEVFVFIYTGVGWYGNGHLQAPDGTGRDSFGASVSIHGNRVLVGAPRAKTRGAAYVFRWDEPTWVHEATLTAPYSDFLGRSVALYGEYAFVGDTLDGKVHVFRRQGLHWSLEGMLNRSAVFGARFGWALRAAEKMVIVSDSSFAGSGTGSSGAAYVFRQHGNAWHEEAILQAPGNASASFGHGIATDGSLAAVGQPQLDLAYVFQPAKPDCNGNRAPDLCDLRAQTSLDCNANDMPDECDSLAAADFDLDDDVDLRDVGALQRCWTDVGGQMGDPCCMRFELQGGDGDVDALDYAAMRVLITGP